MHLFTQWRSQTHANLSELIMPLVNKNPRKIARCSSRKNEESREQNGHSSQGQVIIKSKISTNLKDDLPRFGPSYGNDKQGMVEIKRNAMEHVLKNTSPENPDKAKEIYNAVRRKVMNQIRGIYADISEYSPKEFGEMMIQDGCLFLQLMLLILGYHKELGYDEPNDIFGQEPSKQDIRNWIYSMFFIGNQIPLVVLRELMAQKFFKEVVRKRKLDPLPPLSFCKKTLYDLFVLPAQEAHIQLEEEDPQELPSDLLHGLHNLVIGPISPWRTSAMYEEINLESNEDTIIVTTGKIARNFPSATELSQNGVRFRMLESGGVRSIYFKSYYFWAYLYLPALPIHEEVEIVFRNLRCYEEQLENSEREVNSYLQFMRDILRRPRDVKCLKKAGIVQPSPDDEDELPEMLNRLGDRNMRFTQHFRTLRRELRDYAAPSWTKWAIFSLHIITFLGVLQTFFAILAYFKPP